VAVRPEPFRPKRGCPICGKPSEVKFAPFCSKRCADIDLSRWLKGVYAIPGEPVEDKENGDTVPRGRDEDET
jgi:endogenous inhibitor of DNA gyrase (YacG/DUF329 family)